MFKKYLLVRSKPHGIDKMKEFKEGCLSIGWPVGSTFESHTREEIESKLKPKGWFSGTAVTQIENFVNLSTGDIVMTPAENKSLLIFKVTSPYTYDPSKDSDDIGNPHTVKGEVLTHLQHYPKELEGVIKASRRAVTNITKYSNVIENIIDPSHKEEVPKEPFEITNLALKVLQELLEDESSEIRLRSATEILRFKSNQNK